MSWNDLSMKDRASYIKLGIENGITDLDTIRGIYNKFVIGGPIEKNNDNVSDDIAAALSASIMQSLRILGANRKEGPTTSENVEINNGLIHPSGIAQDTYLLPRSVQERIFRKRGYTLDKGKDRYGTIANREDLDKRDIPVYVKGLVAENLTPISDAVSINGYDYPDSKINYLGWKGKKEDQLIHAGTYTSRYYVDPKTHQVYQRGWDLNDYGGTVGLLADYGRNKYGDILDKIGSPVVMSSPYSPIGMDLTKAINDIPEIRKYIERNHYIQNPIISGHNSFYQPLRDDNGDIIYDEQGFAIPDVTKFQEPIITDVSKPAEAVAKRNQKSLGGNLFAEGRPLKKSYKDFSTRLSKAWHNQDLSQDDYDYQKYYNDDPEEAYRQLESIEKGGQGHFPDEGRSGIYKTSNHPTYPDLGANSWLNNDKIFNMSARQAVPENTDRVLDYLGYDLGYNKGGTKAMYNGAYQLPEVTITPNGNYTELIPNELGTGWMYRNRAGRFDDFNYDYVNRYEGNQKALGGNLFADGGKKATRYRSSSNIRKQISTWEGSTMRTNVPFDRMDTMFNQVLPEGALEKLSQEQLDGLYSFAYNVGTGRFKTRTAPTLAKYLQGNATIEDVKGTMWASGDKKYRGLANRRKKERSMLGAYVPVQETIPMTTPLATPLDITPAVQPIIESNPVIQDNIETLPLAFNTESQKESYYTPGFFDYVNYINQIRQPKQPKQRDRRIWLTI